MTAEHNHNYFEPVPHRWLITFTVMMATIMAAIDVSIVNVALPYMRGNLGASVEEITWVATGYLLSNVIVMPIIAMLTARFGRRRFYLFSILLFTCTSMLCGVAWSFSSLVAFRTLQGIGGGAIIPISQAILRESFPPEDQGKIIGIYGLGVILGPAFGPTLGGWLTDTYSWRWIFFINVPVGVVTVYLISRFIHDPHYLEREKGRIDGPGLAFLVVGLGSLQLMLEKGQQWDWFGSRLIVALTVLAAAGIILFVVRELTTGKPAVELRLFKDINFAVGTFLGGIFGIALYGSLFLLPLFLQEILRYTALDSGLTLMPRSLAMAATMPLAGRLYNRSRAQASGRSGHAGKRFLLLAAQPAESSGGILGSLRGPGTAGDRFRAGLRLSDHLRHGHHGAEQDDRRHRALRGGPADLRQRRHRPGGHHPHPVTDLRKGHPGRQSDSLPGYRQPMAGRGRPGPGRLRRSSGQPATGQSRTARRHGQPAGRHARLQSDFLFPGPAFRVQSAPGRIVEKRAAPFPVSRPPGGDGSLS